MREKDAHESCNGLVFRGIEWKNGGHFDRLSDRLALESPLHIASFLEETKCLVETNPRGERVTQIEDHGVVGKMIWPKEGLIKSCDRAGGDLILSPTWVQIYDQFGGLINRKREILYAPQGNRRIIKKTHDMMVDYLGCFREMLNIGIRIDGAFFWEIRESELLSAPNVLSDFVHKRDKFGRRRSILTLNVLPSIEAIQERSDNELSHDSKLKLRSELKIKALEYMNEWRSRVMEAAGSLNRSVIEVVGEAISNDIGPGFLRLISMAANGWTIDALVGYAQIRKKILSFLAN